MVGHRAHNRAVMRNPEIAGSNPALASIIKKFATEVSYILGGFSSVKGVLVSMRVTRLRPNRQEETKMEVSRFTKMRP